MERKERDFDRWVLLTLRLQWRALELRYEDESGAVESLENGESAWIQADGYTGSHQEVSTLVDRLIAPAALFPRIEAAFNGFDRAREHLVPGVGQTLLIPWLLPVFVVPPPGLEALPWEGWIQEVFRRAFPPWDRCVAVRLLRTKADADPVALPLRVFDGRRRHSMELLRRRSWFANEPAVQSHGIVLLDSEDAARQKASPHVLISDSGDRPRRLDKSRLRLRVELRDPGTLEPMLGKVPVLRLSGTGVPVSEPDPVANLVYALVHDFSLHEIAWMLDRVHGNFRVQLACDPVSNHGLRLSRTLKQVLDDVRAGQLLPAGDPSGQAAIRLARSARYLPFDFSRESRGFSAVSRLLASTVRTGAVEREGDSTARGPRQVDVTLDRYDDFGVLEPIRRSHRTPLRCGWRYRLGLQIGNPDPEWSLLDEPPPPIDDLLPPTPAGEGHQLEVCLYGKAFQLLSPNTVKLVLPQHGPSRPCFFEIRAPQQPGEVDLRVAIYHSNNLLQSFQLTATAEVFDLQAPRSALPRDAKPVKVRLTSSAIPDLGMAPGLKPRALSVALNDDVRQGAHTLMIKGSRAGIDVSVDERDLCEVIESFKGVLERTHDARTTGDLMIRGLAKVGSGLLHLLESARLGVDATLSELRRSERQRVQFVRHGNRLSLPWQVLYDFKVPQGMEFRNPSICRGGAVVAGWPESGQYGCRHRPGEHVICIEGFWAFRHYLELISEEIEIGSEGGTPRAMSVSVPAPSPLLTFGWSVVQELASKQAAEWKAPSRGRMHALSGADAPINQCLWSGDRKPGLLVLLSHLHEADADSNLTRRIYACLPEHVDEHEISARALLEMKARLNPWKDPARPVVLLLACDSSGREIGDLVNLTDSFLQSGAAAVIGTEWNIRADDALAFARHVVDGLLVHGLSLGDVMQAHYREALARGWGTPLLLTAYGNTDLTIEVAA